MQSIRGCRLTNIGRMAIAEALRQGYLFVQLTLYQDGMESRLATLWGWWCAAAGHPEIVIGTTRGSDGVRIRCNLSSTGRESGFDPFRTMARLLGEQQPIDRAGWRFTRDELQVDGLETEEAIMTVLGLVDVVTAGRFRPQDMPTPAAQPVHAPRVPHQTRMERSVH